MNEQKTEPPPQGLPGDRAHGQFIERLIRVDHAGEFGAQRIYEGQLAVLGRTRWGPIIQHMKEQEDVHFEAFEKLMIERRVRPTVFRPVWHVLGYLLGMVPALIDYRAAMACTVAVEETIDTHYQNQINQLGSQESDLRQMIEKFREDELEHRDIGLENDADKTWGYPVLYTMVKTGSRLAIWLSERF